MEADKEKRRIEKPRRKGRGKKRVFFFFFHSALKASRDLLASPNENLCCGLLGPD